MTRSRSRCRIGTARLVRSPVATSSCTPSRTRARDSCRGGEPSGSPLVSGLACDCRGFGCGGAGSATTRALKSVLEAEDHVVERVFPAAEDREHQRADQQHELEFPPGRVRFFELAMDLGGEERDRAEHHDDETEGRELGEEAEDQPQSAGGFGDREDAESGQQTGGDLGGRVSAPQAPLWESVGKKEGAGGGGPERGRGNSGMVGGEQKAQSRPPR